MNHESNYRSSWLRHAPPPSPPLQKAAPALAATTAGQATESNPDATVDTIHSTPQPGSPWINQLSGVVVEWADAVRADPALLTVLARFDAMIRFLVRCVILVIIVAILALTTILTVFLFRVKLDPASLLNPNPFLTLGGFGGASLTITLATRSIRRRRAGSTRARKSKRRGPVPASENTPKGGDAVGRT